MTQSLPIVWIALTEKSTGTTLTIRHDRVESVRLYGSTPSSNGVMSEASSTAVTCYSGTTHVVLESPDIIIEKISKASVYAAQTSVL